MMKSTNKWTDIFIAFIKANRSLLIIYMLNIIVFSSVYMLGRLPFYFLRFSIELSLFLGSCFFRISIFEVLQAVSITGTPG